METPLLFQVEHDLGERFDLAKEQPDLVGKLGKIIKQKKAQLIEEGTFWDVEKKRR